MAARFWVGGTGTWDSTTTANWSATSGGASGASVPGVADDVTINTASITVTTNYNVSIISVTISASAATLSLGGTLTCSGVITLTQGTFTTNNYAVTALSLSSNNTNVRTINLGSSTVTLTLEGIAWATGNPLNLTLNAGTSTLVMTAGNASFDIATLTLTFNNLSFTSTAVGAHNLPQSVDGTIFNNITVAGMAVAGARIVQIPARQTINGTLSTTGTAGNRRVWFRSNTYGIAKTLTINSAPSLTDADFRDIYVVGTAAPISGTRIGDLRGIRGITASTPKTVYWNLAGTQNWNADAWATTSTGTPSTDNFPLAQDAATFTDAGSVTGTITMDTAIPYTGTVDMSGRTSAMTISVAGTIYGDWKNGSGNSSSMTGTSLTFSGRNTQTITSAGKSFGVTTFTIDSYGGTVNLGSAFALDAASITVTNGTFDTKNYAVTAGSLASNNSNVRAINLGSSTVTLLAPGAQAVIFTTSTNLTFNAGTSQINVNVAGAASFAGGGKTFYNVSYLGTQATTHNFTGQNTFNNLSVAAPASAGLMQFSFAANQTINGTLTVAGATAVRRVMVRSDTLGTPRTLTVNSLSAQDCDFRDIAIAGAAAGASPVRAGDCGGNTGITFPAAKTVYAIGDGAANNLTTVGWAPGSGGTPDINQFPLAQDTVIVDNATNTPTLFITPAFNLGTLDSSSRTTAITIQTSSGTPSIYGNFKFGTGVTSGSTGNPYIFSGRGTQTITSNGITFGCPVTIDCVTGTVQLADALTLGSTRLLTLTSGTFDAVTYNVTTGSFEGGSGIVQTLRMGTGTWTLSGTGWAVGGTTTFSFFKNTANIVLSATSIAARAFTGGGYSYNKLTIGGTTGTSTLTINGNNQFTELASTKTVAHTIDLGTTTQTFGAWTVTGTAGNVVTVTGTAAITIAGARVSGVDYLAMNGTSLSNTSPGEFYSGANSTGTDANIIKTAAPTPVTRYWVGGTGTWDATTTTKWSAASGSTGGASVPTSADAVVFDSLSNATAYTVTCTATQLRCGSLNMAGPLTGNVTWAGTAPIAMHDNVILAATGITRTYSGAITLTGSTAGKTLTTNGVVLGFAIMVNGVNCAWTLGSALNMGALGFVATNGSFSLSTYSFSTGSITANTLNSVTINLGSSTITVINAAGITFGTIESNRANLTLTSGTSQLNLSSASPTLSGNNQTFYNVSFTGLTVAGIAVISGANTFNNLTVNGQTSAGLANVSLSANQTINGTLTLSAGTNATMRTFLQSNIIGTTRTLTCAAVAAPTDIDFRDITIAGAAAPVSGTRLGDCKGNSGITFDAAKTVYWRFNGSANWPAGPVTTSWSLTDGGSSSFDYFPLAQDTAVFATYPPSGSTVTINAAYNIGTIDMSARTTNTMTLATGSTTPAIYGNWINGTGTTLTGTGVLTFAGRNGQTITSAGKSFTQPLTVNSPSGSVTLQDALDLTGNNIVLTSGTINAASYNVTFGGLTATGSLQRTLAFGSGTWTLLNGGTPFNASGATNLIVTGTGIISLTSPSAKIFNGNGAAYSGITLNQGGAGSLSITGNNTFANITNTYSATGATSILLGTTTQTVGTWGASGDVGKVLTVTGSSASSPATLVVTGTPSTSLDYLTVTGVRAYSLETTWYAGANSTNNGSLGWYFVAGVIVVPTSSIYYGSINITAIYYGSTPVLELYSGSTKVF